MSGVDPTFWQDRRVLITGHTGFKGAWLCLWLQSMGARVCGASLADAPTDPCLYDLARVAEGMAGSMVCDIRDAEAVSAAVAQADPQVVFHLAAQPLVRRSFAAPRETYETNVMGTVNVLEAVRACPSVEAVVVVTSDKCYENREAPTPYREDDPLGGHDPYSSSKAAAELVTSAYRRSYFSGPAGPLIASARAGNVIGGGDWGEDRLVPDAVRAAVSQRILTLRNPGAIRPWQHVLSPLSGYLVLAQALCGGEDRVAGVTGQGTVDRGDQSSAEAGDRCEGTSAGSRFARAWNFGPDPADARTVEWVVRRVSGLWPGGVPWSVDEGLHPHEAGLLSLDSSLAHRELGWTPLVGLEEGLAATVAWYVAWCEGQDLRELSLGQVGEQG
ncbi:MAG: CDP-glucose 4,6-dehydratase [Solirubrobacteraceae bacterium]